MSDANEPQKLTDERLAEWQADAEKEVEDEYHEHLDVERDRENAEAANRRLHRQLTIAKGERDEAQAVRSTPIVCLCGSTRFGEAFHIAGWEMTLRGIIVLSIGVCKRTDRDGGHGGEALGQDVADRLDELHKRKIDLAHAVIVLNIGGYIGESTRAEIGYAAKIGRPIAYLEARQPPPQKWDDYRWDDLAEGVRRAAEAVKFTRRGGDTTGE